MTTILVVEDNPASRKLAVLVLKNAGYAVLQADEGEQAVRIVRDAMPDLILMDVQMAGMDGLTAAGILKADPATAQIPIIALTAFAMRGDEQKILAAGCDAYITKPYHYPDFLARVALSLEQRGHTSHRGDLPKTPRT
ncbi:MAG: response regulator [Janthinobacterium lividum]